MPTDDAKTLHCIVHCLEANLLVEAGAGTGKTYALVSRVVALVKSGVRMENIVAITFTEAAAAELCDRIRTRMEQILNPLYRDVEKDPLVLDSEKRIAWSDEELALVRQAISELDRASIQTIHSFAARLLRERPMDVGLPPGWAQRDALAASEDFNEHWNAWLEWALGPADGPGPELQAHLRRLLEAGSQPSQWRSVAEEFNAKRHRLASEESIPEGNLRPVFENALQQIRQLTFHCGNPDDLAYQRLGNAVRSVEIALENADDPNGTLELLDSGTIGFAAIGSAGSQENWGIDLRKVRSQFNVIRGLLATVIQAGPLVKEALPFFHTLRREFAEEFPTRRKADGVATFDDLLVWARDLLLNHDARQHLRSRYTRILLDEFQDTDPLQAEIAYYLAAKADAPVGKQPWHTLPLAPCRLFIVGDAKQSIYRFRGADLSVVQKVKQDGQLTELTLSENRRSQETILKWVNTVFGEVMGEDESGQQADYVPLQPNDDVQQSDLVAGVRVFGGGEGRDTNADSIRRQESADIARLITAAMTEGENLLSVYDNDDRCIRPAKLGDVCILIRNRTGLNILERGLEDAGIPFRIEGGTLLFSTQEIQDLLNCVRAIDNPSDAVSVVAALRSPAFACSDANLLDWKDAGRSWNYVEESLPEEKSTVRDGMAVLHEYHLRRHGIFVSRLISDFVRERRLEELDLVEYRPREAWRRRQFVIEQARNLESDNFRGDSQSPLNLHRFILWAEMQQKGSNRIVESPAPETDDDAVRIMTMHAAKGLEFPIVFLLDLDYVPDRGDNPDVNFHGPDGPAEVLVGNRRDGIRTPGFFKLDDAELEQRKAEQIRLSYVAATRARDHLIVSQYHKVNGDGDAPTAILRAITGESTTEFQSPFNVPEGIPDWIGIPVDASSVPTLTYDLEGWEHVRQSSNALRASPQAVTASWIAQRGSSGHIDADVPTETTIEDKDAGPDLEQPWRTGRAGTAFGSALHGVLQDAVARLLLQFPSRQDEPVESLWAWLDAAIEGLARWNADDEGVNSRTDEIVRRAQQAVRNEWVVAALRSERLWPEIPVAARIETLKGSVVIEGIIDLLYLDHDGQLVILDYKSDDVRDEAELEAKLDHYQWQGAAYAYAVERATHRTVKDVRFLFVRQDRAYAIANLRALMEQLPQVIA